MQKPHTHTHTRTRTRAFEHPVHPSTLLTPYLQHFFHCLQEAMTKTFEELIELANKFFSSLPPPPSLNSEQTDRGSRYDNDSGVVPGSTGSATPDSVSRVEVASTLGRPAQTTVMRPTPTRTVTTAH